MSETTSQVPSTALEPFSSTSFRYGSTIQAASEIIALWGNEGMDAREIKLTSNFFFK
jgi:hypothetical protein